MGAYLLLTLLWWSLIMLDSIDFRLCSANHPLLLKPQIAIIIYPRPQAVDNPLLSKSHLVSQYWHQA